MTTRERAKRNRKRRLLTTLLHKQEIIKLLKKEGYDITYVAKELGLCKDTIYSWINKDLFFRIEIEAIKKAYKKTYRGKSYREINPVILDQYKNKIAEANNEE